MLMKPFNKNNLVKAFWKGETTKAEEQQLKQTYGFDEITSNYFRYLETEQLVPSNLETLVWRKVATNRRKQLAFFLQWSVAATAILLIGLTLFISQQQQKTKTRQQFLILEQALQHVSNEIGGTNTENVIYKDECIIIVANTR